MSAPNHRWARSRVASVKADRSRSTRTVTGTPGDPPVPSRRAPRIPLRGRGAREGGGGGGGGGRGGGAGNGSRSGSVGGRGVGGNPPKAGARRGGSSCSS